MITILFGAGASYPFYTTHLSTAYLTEQVKDKSNWRHVLRKYNENNVDGYECPDIDEAVRIITSPTNSKLNFEQLAEIVDKVYSVKYEISPEYNMLNRILYNIGITLNHTAEAQYIPFFFREIIANAIIDSEQKHRVNEYKHLQKLQIDFLRMISNCDEQVSIVSLNYDDCVPKSIDVLKCYDYCFDFIPRKDYYSNMLLNVQKFFESKKVAYFPHGHLRFIFNDREDVTYESNIFYAEEKRWDGIFNHGTCIVTNNSFCCDFNTFITTGQTKDNALNNMPYAVYYQRLATDFLLSNIIILIGYSFGDHHFNRLLKGFLSKNIRNKVLVVGLYPDTLTMKNEYRDKTEFIYKIYDTFRTEWRLFCTPNGELLPMNEAEVERINENGFGQIFDRVYLFKNGYEEFLVRKEEILEYFI